MNASWTYDGSRFGAAARTVRVIATDHLGHAATRTFVAGTGVDVDPPPTGPQTEMSEQEELFWTSYPEGSTSESDAQIAGFTEPQLLGTRSAERAFCIPTRVSMCLKVQELGEKAFTSSRNRFPGSAIEGNKADAYRHCYWSALITLKYDRGTAKGFGDRHEAYVGNDPRQKFMDLHNNSWGREFATRSLGSADPKERVRSRCDQEVSRGGQLIVIVR